MRAGAKQLLFFFTSTELATVIEEFEIKYSVSYYKMGALSAPEAVIAGPLAEQLGHLAIGDWNHSPCYLIIKQNSEVAFREIKLQKGDFSYVIDQQKNPDTIIFKPSGVFAKEILIAGSLSTGSNSSHSVKMFQIFAKIIKRYSSKIGLFYVSPNAKKDLALGWRLVTSSTSPKEYDLALD